jgi:adenylate cyclase
VGGFSRADVAVRAGVELDVLDRLLELGLIGPRQGDTFTPADIRKVGLVESLRSAGIPLEALAGAIRSGSLTLEFLDDPAYDTFTVLGTETFRDLSERTGIPVEVLLVIREAIGSAVAQPDDLVREAELTIVPLLEAQLASGYPAASIERGLRTMGDSLRRVAVAEVDAFATHVIEPVARRPDTVGADIAAAAIAATRRMRIPFGDALLAIYQAQQAHATTANILLEWERALARAGLVERSERPQAMCFFDVTGYTRITSERGDEAAAEMAEALRRLVQRTSVRFGGRPVKWLGDGVMLHFRTPGPGVLAAIEMAEAMTVSGLPPAHVGLHAGPVLFQDGDYFGQTVNVTSRIADYARPGEILVSQAVVDAVDDPAVRFSEVGTVELKGVSESMRLHIASRAEA